MDKIYFFVDGTYLIHCVDRMRKANPTLLKKKLHIGKLADGLLNHSRTYAGSYGRAMIYFRKNDPRLASHFFTPKSNKPSAINHWKVVQCAEKNITIPKKELEKLEPKYQRIFPRAEKGLDIKLSCDSLFLISTQKADIAGFIINDLDYFPLLETIQNLGGNVYLYSLSSNEKIQDKLTDLCDIYHEFNGESYFV